jgi:uncharacterized protein (TIGR03083 family)
MQLDKDDTLAGLFAAWGDIERVLNRVPAERWRAPTPLPGWSVQDVVAHIVGTESMLKGVPTPASNIDVMTLGHVHNAVGAMNECWVRHFRGESVAGVFATYRAIVAERRTELEALSEASWNAVTATPAGRDSYGRFMRIRTFDCWMHEHDIRDALGVEATDEELRGTAPRLALDEVVASLGFVVGKRGKAPEGSRILIDLTGPLARAIRIAVDGRAAVVDDFDGAEPTTVIRMDGLQFTRLCGGRPMSSARPWWIDFEGDATAGQRIIENLNYVI